MLQDRRVVIGLGAAAAVVLGLGMAFLFRAEDPGPKRAPPAAKGGLQVSVDDPRPADPARPLRCFVEGQYVGMATLPDCARRNGVASQQLDVGYDESGLLSAAPTASLAPPPAAPIAAAIAPSAEPIDVAADAGPTAACLRYASGEWRQVGEAPVAREACVRALYDGRCERPGGAQYGRWGETTLRLVPGRVEQSSDNAVFATLVEQGRGCSIVAPR